MAAIAPIYTPENCRAAYQLTWSLSVFWKAPLPPAEQWLEALHEATKADGVRLLEHRAAKANVSQFFVSTPPELSPADFVRSIKGRLQYLVRQQMMETTCPVRYVITVDKLREGWDCPLAYVLGSIGNSATPTAVEQLIGRVLRMPFANRTNVPALDRAYAFVLSDDVVRTAMQLRDRMVETCGFDERSAKDALRVTANLQGALGMASIPLSAPPPMEQLPTSLLQRAKFDPESSSLVLSDLPSRREIEALRECLSEPQDRAAVDAFWQREHR